MQIHSVEWVKANIQPVLNIRGGEIYGGFVRDYVVGNPFKDVDINYPHSFSEEKLEIFRRELLAQSGCKVQYIDTCEAYDDEGERKVLRSKLKVSDGTLFSLDYLEIDLIWDGQADDILDVDIHALYLDNNWSVKIYDQPKYRNALVNATLKQFIALAASPRRIKKLIKKGYHQFTEGFLAGLWEKVDEPKRLQEYENPLYLDLESFSQLKIGSDVFIHLGGTQNVPYLATNGAQKYQAGPVDGLYPCEIVQIEEMKTKDYEGKRALILVPKGTGFRIEPNKYVAQVEAVQCDGYYVRARGKNGTQSC